MHIRLRLGAHGVTDRECEGIGPLALIRESQSRRVIVVRVEKKSGPNQVAQFIWLDRPLPQDFIQGYENTTFDLYYDEFGNKTQA